MEQTLSNGPVPSTGGFKDSNLAQAWLVLTLALIFGAALAAVQVNLSGKIATNKRQETLARVPEMVWGAGAAARMAETADPVDIAAGTITVKKKGKTSSYNLFRVTAGNTLAGWVVKAGGQGYADKIELLIGLDAKRNTITGLFVLEQKETPGLGNKIIVDTWRNQFIGKRTDLPLTVIKTADRGAATIDAVTGATISSKAVIGIVNTTIADIQGPLAAENVHYEERKEQ